VREKGLPVADKATHYYEISTNHLLEKKSPLVENDEVKDAIRSFMDFRLTAWAHQPFTEKAVKLFSGSLITHSRNHHEAAVKIINRSIEMGWKGIFKLPEDEWQGIYKVGRQDQGKRVGKTFVPKMEPVEALPKVQPGRAAGMLDRLNKRMGGEQ
jgi:hypothetical protein